MRLPGQRAAAVHIKAQHLPVHAALAIPAARNAAELVPALQAQPHPLAREHPLALPQALVGIQAAQLHHVLHAHEQPGRAQGVAARAAAPGHLAIAHRAHQQRPEQRIQRASHSALYYARHDVVGRVGILPHRPGLMHQRFAHGQRQIVVRLIPARLVHVYVQPAAPKARPVAHQLIQRDRLPARIRARGQLLPQQLSHGLPGLQPARVERQPRSGYGIRLGHRVDIVCGMGRSYLRAPGLPLAVKRRQRVYVQRVLARPVLIALKLCCIHAHYPLTRSLCHPGARLSSRSGGRRRARVYAIITLCRY